MSDDKSKLLWHSNAPWSSTGYGSQTALFAKRLAEHYNLACSSFWGLEGNVIPWNGIPVMPGVGQTYGNETILDHADVHFGKSRGGLVLTLMDVWVLDPVIWRQLNTACWVPVDHEPAPGPVVGFLKDSGAVPIAMSKFGQQMLGDAGLDPLYVPHAVDTTEFKPYPQDEAREITKMPADAFIVGMVAANKGNPSRKCFPEALQAFKALHDQHDDARLYLHTEAHGRFDGVDLPALIDAVGIPRKLVFFCDQYRAVHYPFPAERMAQIYSSFDVMMLPSAGEGFGIPALEAQACGVPVIVSDFSAQPELCGSGWLVSGSRTYTPMKAWQFKPDVADIYDALRQAYTCASAKTMGVKAREFAMDYGVETVMADHMLPALEAAYERFGDRQPIAVAA